ncbi:MAG: ATP-binding protein [Acidimicrobiia bacterium]|nr:ATP-binding protein [Acidimicrobiia bacterium]
MGTITRLEGRLDDEKRHALLETASEQGDRLQRLINELLVVASTEHDTVAINHRPVAVAQLLEQVVRDTSRLTDGRATASVGVGIETVVTDPVKLQQILSNLVENAGKYAPDGPIEVRASRSGAEILFTIDDQGPGIPAEDRERVFQRFVQLDQSSTRRQGGRASGSTSAGSSQVSSVAAWC